MKTIKTGTVESRGASVHGGIARARIKQERSRLPVHLSIEQDQAVDGVEGNYEGFMLLRRRNSGEEKRQQKKKRAKNVH